VIPSHNLLSTTVAPDASLASHPRRTSDTERRDDRHEDAKTERPEADSNMAPMTRSASSMLEKDVASVSAISMPGGTIGGAGGDVHYVLGIDLRTDGRRVLLSHAPLLPGETAFAQAYHLAHQSAIGTLYRS